MVVIPSTIETLSQYADDLLQVCEDAIALTQAGVPERVYVSPAPPAFDCEQLTLFVNGLFEAPTSPLAPIEETALRGKFGNVILVSYIIDVVRCSASGTLTAPPAASALTAVAHTVEDDMFSLWNGVRHAHEDGDIFDGCLGVHFDGITPLRDEGGFCGCEMRLRASIPGIPNA